MIPKVGILLLSAILVASLLPNCLEQKLDEKYEVRVVRIVDGDTFYAEVDGKIIKVRILGIDAPEVKAERNKPYEYEDITNLTCLAEWGKLAADFLKEEIEGKTVLLIFDEKAGKKDRYGRVLAYVYYKNKDIAAEMLKLGYARVFVSEFEKLREYLNYQNQAIKRKIGVWSCD